MILKAHRVNFKVDKLREFKKKCFQAHKKFFNLFEDTHLSSQTTKFQNKNPFWLEECSQLFRNSRVMFGGVIESNKSLGECKKSSC